MTSSSFYWENLGQEYPFNPYKKYLIYFKGCFCPPHRGHFNMVKQFTDKGDNIHVMIHQMGSESRHGVPKRLNREIWRFYINELLPTDRVHLIQHYSTLDILDLDILNQIDTVLYIRGNEGYEIDATKERDLRIFRRIISNLKRMNIDMDFYYMDRQSVDTLCATQYVKTLIKTRGRCKKQGCDCKYERQSYFMPEGLHRDTVLMIGRKLQKRDLK